MKILAFPKKSENPYQGLLYTPMRDYGADVANLAPLTASATLNVLTWIPLLVWHRMRGYRILHIHWANILALHAWPWSTGIGKRLVYFHYVLFLKSVKGLGYKLVWTAHNLLPHEQAFYDDLKARKLLVSLSDLVIVHSERTLEELKEKGIRPNKSVVIPIGNYDIYPNTVSKDEARKKLGLGRDTFVYTFVGLIRDYKGVDVLIEAFKELGQPDAHLLIAGACEDAQLQKMLKENVGGSIHWSNGKVPDDELQIYLNASDVVALPFKQVTTSSSVLLALSFAKPVIIPNLGDLIYIPDEASFKYPSAELATLLDAMKKAYARRDALAGMGEAGNTYAKQFSWPAISKKTLEAFAELG